MLKHAVNKRSARRGPGRPRSERARKAILRSTVALLKRHGFSDLSMEAVAAHAKVGKATLYRWWSNKAELVVDAFVSVVERDLKFSVTGPVQKTFRDQMRNWTQAFRSPLGQVIAAVIGAGQSDPEILQAFRTHWMEPRRVEARKLLAHAVEIGEIKGDIDFDTFLDLLYGPLYLRLLLKNAPLTHEFVDIVFDTFVPRLSPSDSSKG